MPEPASPSDDDIVEEADTPVELPTNTAVDEEEDDIEAESDEVIAFSLHDTGSSAAGRRRPRDLGRVR